MLATRMLQGSGQFIPTSIADCQLWLAANKITGLSDDDDVTTWLDASGQGHNATQATAGNKPHYKTNILNTLPVVRFTGASSHWLTLGTELGKPANHTIFVVGMLTNTAVDQAFITSINATPTANTYCWVIQNIAGLPGKGYYAFGNGTDYSDGYTANVVIANNTYTILTSRYTNTHNKCDMWAKNKVEAVNTNTTPATSCTGTAYELAIGRAGAWAARYLTGDIAEVVLYNRALTTAEITSVNTYLGKKYNIALAA